MPIFLKNLILVFGGVAVVGGGVVVFRQFQEVRREGRGATASILDVVVREPNSIASQDSSVSGAASSNPAPDEQGPAESPAAPRESANTEQSEEVFSPRVVAPTAPVATALPIASVLPGFMTISGYIGPAGGGGSSVNSGSPAVVAQESAAATPNSTIAIEVVATTTTSTAPVAATAPVPLALCVLDSSTTSTQSQAAAVVLPEHLVISSILVDNEGADTNEFVEIFNPTEAPISLTGWSLQYLAGSAASFTSITKKNFIVGSSVGAKEAFVIGMGDFGVSADMRWSQSLNNTGATLFLVHGQTLIGGVSDVRIVDRVAYGSGAGLRAEGEPAALPPVGQLLVRKSIAEGACVISAEQSEPNYGCDTNNNVGDFAIESVATPPQVSAE